MSLPTAGRLVPSLVLALAAVSAHGAEAPAHDHDHDHHGHDHAPTPAPSTPPGSATLPHLDVSLDVLTAAGASTATDAQLEALQGGHHDPKRRGFTLQLAELILHGSFDGRFEAEAHLVAGEEGVELEEGFVTANALPYGLSARAGYYLSEVGTTNPLHPHLWHWLDQPIAATRFLGEDGMRGAGARLAWRGRAAGWRAKALAGAQDARDESMVSFLGGEDEPGVPPATIGGRPAIDRPTRSLADLLWSARLVGGWDADGTAALLGASVATGPNRTGLEARTLLLGADLELRHGPCTLALEGLWRRFEAAEGIDPVSLAPIAADTLDDHVLRGELRCRVASAWLVGGRVERASGGGDSYEIGTGAVGRDTDPLRDDRWRLSPLVMWDVAPSARLRLQYAYDRADHLPEGKAHSAWLGLEVLIGAHPHHEG